MTLDLYDSGRLVTQNAPVPVDGTLPLKGQTWRLTATEAGDRVRINVAAAAR
jgi:hypothetical protein